MPHFTTPEDHFAKQHGYKTSMDFMMDMIKKEHATPRTKYYPETGGGYIRPQPETKYLLIYQVKKTLTINGEDIYLYGYNFDFVIYNEVQITETTNIHKEKITKLFDEYFDNQDFDRVSLYEKDDASCDETEFIHIDKESLKKVDMFREKIGEEKFRTIRKAASVFSCETKYSCHLDTDMTAQAYNEERHYTAVRKSGIQPYMISIPMLYRKETDITKSPTYRLTHQPTKVVQPEVVQLSTIQERKPSGILELLQHFAYG